MNVQEIVENNISYLYQELQFSQSDRLLLSVRPTLGSLLVLATCSKLKQEEPGIHLIPLVMPRSEDKPMVAKAFCQYFDFEYFPVDVDYFRRLFVERTVKYKHTPRQLSYGPPLTPEIVWEAVDQGFTESMEIAFMKSYGTLFDAYILPNPAEIKFTKEEALEYMTYLQIPEDLYQHVL